MEKEMPEFRKWITALAGLALFAGIASAQVTGNGFGTGAFTCTTTNGSVTPTLRAEGYTETVGDIVLICSGGTLPQGNNGVPVPTANFAIFLNTAVTSRLLPTATISNASEALLMIDEPGASLSASPETGYGPAQQQIPCGAANIGVGAGPGGCVEYMGTSTTSAGNDQPNAAAVVPVASVSSATACTVAAPCGVGANVFQGIVSGNQVSFYGIPVVPPGTSGTRVYRITNIRVNANGIAAGVAVPGSATASIAISSGPAITNSTLTVGFVSQGLSSANTLLRNSSNTANGSSNGNSFAQSSSVSITSTSSTAALGILQFSENFPGAFKVRQAAPVQNIPGTIYNSESDFVSTSTGYSSTTTGFGTTYFPGQADYGTRLKALFSNVPSGVSIYVSTRDVVNAFTTPVGGASGVLVVSETASDAVSGTVPVAGQTGNYTAANAAMVPIAPVALSAGTGAAVWEVVAANPAAIETLGFAVFINYTAAPATNSPAPGAITVTLSFAPTPSGGAFTSTAGAAASGALTLPRFSDSFDITKNLANIVSTLVITTSTLPNGKINTAYTPTTLTATGGITPYNWTATGLPTGLTLVAGTGVLSGTPTVVGQFTVHVTLTDNSGQTAYASLPLTIVSNLVILTTSMPSGAPGIGYSATFLGSGGTQPYMWVATGLPPGLSLNSSTGLVSGSPTQSGSFSVSVTLTDASGQMAKASFGVTINSPPPPVQITTTSLPNGTVGVFYAAQIAVSGGTGPPYTFIVTSAAGSLPPGLQLSNGGQLQGTPTATGSFSFGVTASDPANNTASATISITIVPAPLVITTTALSSVAVGSSVGIAFTATGGVPPLVFSLSGTAPAGTTFSSAGLLSGTATTAGSYPFTVVVTDSAKNTASKGFTLTVTPLSLTITTASLPNGQAGASYAAQFAAAGGTPPYTWSGTAGGGLSVSSSGAVSGTPTAAGTYTVSVTVTDSSGTKVTGNFSVLVNPSTLVVTTSGLPGGALTAPYSASLSAKGGTPPYTWTAGGLPPGITVSSSGSLSGTPTSPGAFTVTVTVKDSTGVTATASLGLAIAAAPLKITTTGISPPTLGTAFSLAFGATGGTPPYTWSGSGLPAGVTFSSTGTLSGTLGAVGSSSITVTVTDSTGMTATETLTLTVALPAAPGVTFTGLPSTANPATQSTASVTFSAAYPVDVTVNLTLTFTPLSGADDPNIQFSTGGRTTTLTVKAGTTTSTTTIGVQTGTVAGTITITTQLLAAGQDITPVPPPTKTIVIGPAAPSITSVTAAVNSTGFTVTVDGFDPTRAITQVVFTFAAAGSSLQTSTVTVSAASLFTSWYQSAASIPFGSQFSFTMPFTVTGNVQSIASVTVTLVNPTGTSAAMSATL
jgi:hypothetical protein